MKFAKLLFVLTIAALVAACAPVAVPGAAPAEPAAEPISMTYYMWDPSFEETEQLMVDKFNAAHPGMCQVV